MKKMKLLYVSAVVAMAAVLSNATARAQLVASEPFGYTPSGSLLTSLTGDGTGFSTSPNAWVTDYDSWVATGSSLVYQASPGTLLAFTGGAAANNTVYYPRTYRQLAAPLGGGTNVVWISFVSHRNETTPINWWLALQDGFSVAGTSTPVAPDYTRTDITAGTTRINFGENYGSGNPGYNMVFGDGEFLGGPAVTTGNILWVIKLDFNAGQAYYWWNPTTLGGADPDVGTSANGGSSIGNWTFNAIWLNQQPGSGTAPGGVETAGIQIDEIRFGKTYADVTPSVSALATTTTLTSSANPVNVGSSVTLTATVSPVASGTVTFINGATVLGTGTLSGGVATLVTSSLPVGYDSLTASYGGNGTYAPSTSSALTQEVDASPKIVTTTTLTGPTTIKYGDNTYYTAYVETNGVTAGSVLNTLKFYDGANLLATAGSQGTALGGQGAFAIGFTAPLTVGTHNITAVYSGDPNYTGSTSTVYSVTINYPDQTFSDAFTNVSGPNPTDSGGWAQYYGNFNQNWQRTSTNMVSTGYAYDGIYKNWVQAPGNNIVSISYDIAEIGLNGTWISLSLFTNVNNLGADGPAASHGAPQIRINDSDLTGTNVVIQIYDAGNNFLGGINESLSSTPSYSNIKLIYNTTTGLGNVQFDGTNIFTAVNFNTTGTIQGYVLDDLVVGPGAQLKNFVLSSANSSAPPTLTVSESGSNVIVSWPSVNLGWTLQTSTSLNGSWTAVAGSTAVTSVTNSIGSGNLFYRLKQ